MGAKKYNFTLIDKFEPFLTQHKRFKVAFGGRGGTKSQTIAELLTVRVKHGAKVCCLREHQNTIEDSVYSLIVDTINKKGLDGFTVTKNTIEHDSGGKFRFKGLSRNIGGIKSFHGFDIFWLEEAQFITQRSLKELTPTLRKSGAECWLSFNPLSKLDPVAIRFMNPFIKELRTNGIYEDDLHYIIWTNIDENPWAPESLLAEMEFDFKMLPRAEFDHIWLGHFNDSVENSIIKAEWFDAAIDAHKVLGFKALGHDIVSHDPSDMGLDAKGLCYRHGSVIKDVQLLDTGDVNEGIDWALDYAHDTRPDWFVWDAEGIGLALLRSVETALDNTHTDFVAFKGGGSVERPNEMYDGKATDRHKARKNVEEFINLRAQKYWHLRDRFVKTYLAVEKGVYFNPTELISISSDIELIDQLRSEICRIPRVQNGKGKVQIMSKKEMKAKFQIESPNLADAVMMSEVDVSLYTLEGERELEQESLW